MLKKIYLTMLSLSAVAMFGMSSDALADWQCLADCGFYRTSTDPFPICAGGAESGTGRTENAAQGAAYQACYSATPAGCSSSPRISHCQDLNPPRITKIKLCNNNTVKLFFTYASYQSSWTTQGFWGTDPGECTTLSLGDRYTGNVYVTASISSNNWPYQSGDTTFCVDSVNAFTLSSADSRACNGANQKRVKMTKHSVTPGATRTINFNR